MCSKTGKSRTSSPASSLLLKMGISAPYFSETLAISSLSVETIVLLINFEARECSMENATNGTPFIFAKFFSRIPFEPPLAGIIVSIFIFYLLIYSALLFFQSVLF